MSNALVEVCLQAGVVALLALVCAAFTPRSLRLGWLLAALAMIVVHDALLLRLYGLLPSLPGSGWNWSGKGLATLGTLLVAALPVFGWRRSGLTLRQATGSRPAWVSFGILTAALLVTAISLGDGREDWDTILFQWTMPGIEEEIFYRGVLLLALSTAFAGRFPVLGAEIGCGGLLATVAFGLIHSLFYGTEGVSFDPSAFAITGGPALLLLWFREKTGSVVLPILAHNVANGVFVSF